MPVLNLSGARLDAHIRKIEAENKRMVEVVPERNQAYFDPDDIPKTRLLKETIQFSNPAGYRESVGSVQTRLPLYTPQYGDEAMNPVQADLGPMHPIVAHHTENPHFVARNQDLLYQSHLFDSSLKVPSYYYDARPELRYFAPVIAGCLAEVYQNGSGREERERRKRASASS